MTTTEIREILKNLKVTEDLIQVIQNTDITLIKDTENILKLKISKEIAYELYCDDFLPNSEITEISFLDVVYSSEDSDAFERAYKRAALFVRRVAQEDFAYDNVGHQALLACYLLVRVNEYKYSQLKSINDVVEPVPFQIYRKLLNNSKENIEVYVEENEFTYAGTLRNIEVHNTMMGPQIYAYINIISKDAEEYVQGRISTRIHPEAFVSSIEDMGLKAVTEELKAQFTKAGKNYVKLTKEPTYCEYHGEAYTEGWMGDTRHRVDSRVMVDIASFKLLNPKIRDRWYKGDIFDCDCTIGEDVPEDKLWMCSPVVYGFSFSNKIWCYMASKNITDIKFSENAFDDLIIPQENKEVFIASLTHDMPSLDSISDKGAGKIFLLYGAPGVGKTMTAESVAEFLQKPLYYVSVGELGVRPEELEKALDNVMKVATSWDAIILLDEVDVFAVKRDGASIERNAMTAIFLRMLERYSGVMFMTTNLLNNLDNAFISRSTAVIKYHNLTADDRAKIWNGLFDKIEILNTLKISDDLKERVKDLSQHDLNGRVIKNTVRLAYSLAISKNEELSLEHINTALSLRQI